MVTVSTCLCYLSFTNDQWFVTNWPGSLRFPVYAQSHGSHNIGRNRHDVWLEGPDGHIWHGVQIGDWNQVCHAKRTKELIASVKYC